MCQNLIINPPYCEKWISPELLFLRQRSSVWSAAPSSPPWGLCGSDFGSGCSFSGVRPAAFHFFQAHLSCPCSFHHILDSGCETVSPFPALQLSSLQMFPRAPGLDCGTSLLGGSGSAELTLISHCPQLFSVRICRLISLPSFSESGWEKCYVGFLTL